MEEDPHQPHDKLFKQGFSDPTNAAAFLRHQFSDNLADAIDWQSLTLQSGSFVDSSFRASESDLLFSTSLAGSPVQLYLLFEHQRTADPSIALRLLRYMVRIWERHLTATPGEPLPLILPVVLAHNDRCWEIASQLGALFELPEPLRKDLAAFLPDFSFRLIQLAELPFDQIRGTPAGILTLRVMKAERCNQLLGDEVWDEQLIQDASLSIFQQILNYIAAVGDLDRNAFLSKLKTVNDPTIQKAAMTLAQQFRQEGRQEGERLLLERLLVRKFGELEYTVLEKLKHAGQADLEKWGERILDAKTLDEVFSGV